MTRSHPEFLLEHTGEILRIRESQRIGDLRNGTTVQQQGLGLLHHKMADELRSTLAGFHTDQTALNRYHSSPMMQEAAALREKYKLGGRQIRRFNPLAQDARAFVQTVDFSVWPKGQPNTAYAQYFTGNSYLAPLDGGVANVTFEPGCRNNWHIHHRQVQVLICVAGRGWYQEWGKPAVQLIPGTIIEIPEGAKHWHGAAADCWMQHLTFHKDVQDGASNEWLEPVSEEQYQRVR